MVHDIAAFHYNAFGAPRHGCKTTVAKVLALLLVLTRRNYGVGYLTSKQTKYREFVNDIRKQLTSNQLILSHFGEMKPPRGGDSWNSDQAELVGIGTSLTGMSLDSRERGWHGECLFVDDPERDPETDEVIPEYVRKLDHRLRVVFMPMVEVAPDDLDRREISRVGRGITYFGTIIGEDMVLNRIITAEPGGPFDAWNRWRFERESKGNYIWPQRWGKRSSAITRRVLGEDAYDSEEQGRPGKSQKGIFSIHPLYHCYYLEDSSGDYLKTPYNSGAYLRWAVRQGDSHAWKSLPAPHFLSAMNIGIIVDPIQTENVSRTSDYMVAHVFGNDANATLWSLDLRRGRWDTEEAVRNIVELCILWHPTFVAIERCGVYGRLADEILIVLRDRLLAMMGWVPYPKPLGPFNKVTESKGARIERVAWRFWNNRIRFPAWRKAVDPYDQCWHEVENFTRNLSKLKYDDIVDTIGLTWYCFAGPGGRPVTLNEWDGKTVEELILSGKFVSEGGAHLLDMIPSVGDLSDEAIYKLEGFYSGKEKKKPKIKFVEAKQHKRYNPNRLRLLGV